MRCDNLVSESSENFDCTHLFQRHTAKSSITRGWDSKSHLKKTPEWMDVRGRRREERKEVFSLSLWIIFGRFTITRYFFFQLTTLAFIKAEDQENCTIFSQHQYVLYSAQSNMLLLSFFHIAFIFYYFHIFKYCLLSYTFWFQKSHRGISFT